MSVELLRRDWQSVTLERDDVALDGFADVLNRGLASVALRHAALGDAIVVVLEDGRQRLQEVSGEDR